jgi:hypothetical protein
MMPRTANPETSLEVDKLILEFFLLRATKGLLAERRAAKSGQPFVMDDPPDHVLQILERTAAPSPGLFESSC